MTLNTEAFAKALAAGIAAYEAASKEKDGWIVWSGGKCPVDADTAVDVRFQDGSTDDGEIADYWNWDAKYSPITAYRLAK